MFICTYIFKKRIIPYKQYLFICTHICHYFTVYVLGLTGHHATTGDALHTPDQETTAPGRGQRRRPSRDQTGHL